VLRGGQALLVVAWISNGSGAAAAIPAGYTGTPYLGKAQEIPGRVELANLDEGGLNISFFADHRRENAKQEGYSPISGDDYRAGNLNLPNICKTNRALEKPGEGSEDFWEDGKRYPSEDKPYEYYMGYAHTVDWVRVTVNVKQAGKYRVSSNWACANPKCGLSIWFNDGTTTRTDNAQRPLDGENKSGIVMLDGTNDYHKWRAYPNFATVDLAAGEQVMTFNLEVADHLQYGFLQFDRVGGDPSGGGGSGGGAGGTNGSGGADGGGVGGTSGSISGAGSVGTEGMAGTPPGGGARSPGYGGGGGAAGAPATGAGGAGMPGGGGGNGTNASAPESKDSGGCAVARGPAQSGALAAAMVAALASLRRRRHR